MKSVGWLAAVLVIVSAIILSLRGMPEGDAFRPTSPTPSPTPIASAPGTNLQPHLPSQRLASELNAEANEPGQDVVTLHQIITMYIRALGNRQGRPIGDDIDLARALTGQNPMHQYFLPPHHPSLAVPRHLVDRWGTPYFIHSWGHNAFEVRSAGPDRKLFTDDDLIANPSPKRR